MNRLNSRLNSSRVNSSLLSSSRVSNKMKRLSNRLRGSTHSCRGRTGWIRVKNYLSSTKDKVTDVLVNMHNEC
jgi:hypothetical protein